MNVSLFPVNPFVENTYILWTRKGGEAAIVDPGMMREDERHMINEFIKENELILKHVLITHIHIDHVTSARWIAEQYAALVEGDKLEEPYGLSLHTQAEHFRLRINVDALKFDKYLKENDIINLGEERIIVLSTPGHSVGSLSFYAPESNFVITGDALFEGSIGRTDLPGGDYDTLISSIRNKLFTLPADTLVYSGHGEATTIGDEMRYNPYF